MIDQVRALGAGLRALRAEAYIERGKAIWVDCPECGKVPPKTAIHPGGYRYMLASKVRYADGIARWGYCSGCDLIAPARTVNLKASVRAVAQCDLRCLNAKGDDCNCFCQGGCHGRGTCSCALAESGSSASGGA